MSRDAPLLSGGGGVAGRVRWECAAAWVLYPAWAQMTRCVAEL